MSQQDELNWIAVASSPPWEREDLTRTREALERKGFVVKLAPTTQDGTRYELHVRPQDLEAARRIVLDVRHAS